MTPAKLAFFGLYLALFAAVLYYFMAKDKTGLLLREFAQKIGGHYSGPRTELRNQVETLHGHFQQCPAVLRILSPISKRQKSGADLPRSKIAFGLRTKTVIPEFEFVRKPIWKRGLEKLGLMSSETLIDHPLSSEYELSGQPEFVQQLLSQPQFLILLNELQNSQIHTLQSTMNSETGPHSQPHLFAIGGAKKLTESSLLITLENLNSLKLIIEQISQSS